MITKKQIDKIVWWIPFKSIRDIIRFYLLLFLDLRGNYTNLNRSHASLSKKCDALINSNRELNEKLNLIFREKNENALYRKPTVLIYINAGLCDQIRYYTLGLYIEMFYNKKVKYTINWYDKNSDRNFELLNIVPDLDLDIVSEKERKIYEGLYATSIAGKSLHDLMIKFNNSYFYGFPKETAKIEKKMAKFLIKRFDLDNNLLPQIKDERNLAYYKEIINSECSVAVHVRRGDYIEHCEKKGYILHDENYILSAISRIKHMLTTPPLCEFSH